MVLKHERHINFPVLSSHRLGSKVPLCRSYLITYIQFYEDHFPAQWILNETKLLPQILIARYRLNKLTFKHYETHKYEQTIIYKSWAPSFKNTIHAMPFQSFLGLFFFFNNLWIIWNIDIKSWWSKSHYLASINSSIFITLVIMKIMTFSNEMCIAGVLQKVDHLDWSFQLST